MGLADYFDRVALAGAQAVRGLVPAEFAARLERTEVEVVFGPQEDQVIGLRSAPVPGGPLLQRARDVGRDLSNDELWHGAINAISSDARVNIPSITRCLRATARARPVRTG